MTTLFIILIVLASAVLALVVLVQNPKGGGLAGSIGGFSNQFMGVKQTTDVLEKGTWIFAGVIALLCLFSVMFISGSKSGSTNSSDASKATGAPVPASSQPATTPGTLTLPTTTPPANTPK